MTKENVAYKYICMKMESFSAIKKEKEILPFAATWLDLADIMLSEIRQRKDKYHMISLICEI